MSVADWVIVAFALLLALRGYSRGFIVSALALIGFGAGALIGTHVGPLILSRGAKSPYAPIFSLGGALLLGGLVGTVSEGIGLRARRLLFIPGLKFLDGLAGAALSACLALATVWILGAILLQVDNSPGLRHQLAASRILRTLNEILPPSGPILNTLARIDPLPAVNGPAASVSAPAAAIVNAPGVIRASPSVVKITGSACGLGVEGSGWVAGPGLVVTNAHVVAGENDTQVLVASGTTLPARAILFDPHNDIAILRVPDLKEPALRLDSHPTVGLSAAILGFPEDGPFNRQPARLGDTEFTETQNAYGNGPVLRDITALRGLVRPGNSGGPIVDAAGQVVATVFAQITNNPVGRPGGFAVPNRVVAVELARARRARHAVSTQACAD
ncbi:MarP family serine protease [Conexibacter sp. DBS9H8]|uniref:MarP family serine protease n=1 Tax=Conexibacter sp. DBS9H8 TaxID=2937801 RepID=UPI00200D07A8|nr:MarP family serine protease [Conexibacter sp. DBS9H8]